MQKIVGGYLIGSEYTGHWYSVYYIDRNGIKSPLNSYKTEDEVNRLTDAEILEKAKANVGEEALKAESDAQKLAQKALDDAKAKLPKGEAKTEEQLVKEFIEKNGEKSEAMKKAFGEDVKALLEKKIPNKKLAAYIGGGAAILAALGYMIAPKHSEDIA